MLRWGRIRKVFSETWLADKGVEVDLKELVDMFDRNQLGIPRPTLRLRGNKGVRERGEIVKSLRNGGIVRRAGVDIAEIRRRAGIDLRSRRKEDGMPVWIINGWRREDLSNMEKKDNPREEYARGWLRPNARWAGISTDCE